MTTGKQKRYFEFQDDKSAKFWEVTTEGMSVTVRYGKIGTAGQSQEKTFENIDYAQKHVEKLISDKVKKGYALQNPDENISGKSLRSGGVTLGEPTGRIDAPAEFEKLRALFIEICELLDNEPTENGNINRVRNEFIADFENAFKSGAWSWTPVTIQVEDQKVDRLGEVVMGPIFTSEDHAWPEQDGLPMAPLIQLDLRIASEIGGVQLGDGLLQVWMPKYSFERPVFIRVIPRQDVNQLKLTPIVDIPEDLDPIQPRDEVWNDELEDFSPSPAIQITGYALKRFTSQIRHPIQDNYSIGNLTQRDETSSRIKEFDKRVKPLLKKGEKGFDAGNCHLFGTFVPIQYKSDDKPTPLFCFESDEFGLMWGDGGNAQLFYSLDSDGKVTFSFDWSCT